MALGTLCSKHHSICGKVKTLPCAFMCLQFRHDSIMQQQTAFALDDKSIDSHIRIMATVLLNQTDCAAGFLSESETFSSCTTLDAPLEVATSSCDPVVALCLSSCLECFLSARDLLVLVVG